MALILTVMEDEEIKIGDDVTLRVHKDSRGRLCYYIDAPRSVNVKRVRAEYKRVYSGYNKPTINKKVDNEDKS